MYVFVFLSSAPAWNKTRIAFKSSTLYQLVHLKTQSKYKKVLNFQNQINGGFSQIICILSLSSTVLHIHLPYPFLSKDFEALKILFQLDEDLQRKIIWSQGHAWRWKR